MAVHADQGNGRVPLDRRLAGAMEALEDFEKRFHPPRIEELKRELSLAATDTSPPLIEIHRAGGGAEAEEIIVAAGMLREALDILMSASTTEIFPLLASLRSAVRNACRAREILYLHRRSLPAVDLHFLEPEARHDPDAFSSPGNGDPERGLFHRDPGGGPYGRGALSLYVPEWTGDSPLPLVAALHGGHGHGRDFIWTLMREARSRGFILAAPTSLGNTWNLMKPEEDMAAIEEMLDAVSRRWPVDRKRVLVTGFSDGGSMALAAAHLESVPFTAFAPVSGTVPPGRAKFLRNRRILWLHGSRDWMFPPERAASESALLKLAGAELDFRIVPELSHTYPLDRNGEILEWFDPGLRVAAPPPGADSG